MSQFFAYLPVIGLAVVVVIFIVTLIDIKSHLGDIARSADSIDGRLREAIKSMQELGYHLSRVADRIDGPEVRP